MLEGIVLVAPVGDAMALPSAVVGETHSVPAGLRQPGRRGMITKRKSVALRGTAARTLTP